MFNSVLSFIELSVVYKPKFFIATAYLTILE